MRIEMCCETCVEHVFRVSSTSLNARICTLRFACIMIHMNSYELRKFSVNSDLTSKRTRNCYSVDALDLAVSYLMSHMNHMRSKKATLNTPNESRFFY